MFDRNCFVEELKHLFPKKVLETLARFCGDWGCEVLPPEEVAEPTGDAEMARFMLKNAKDNAGISCSFVSAE